MKKRMAKLIEEIESGKYTAREIVLAGITLFLLGMVIGAVFTPKKNVTIGSNNCDNGCNNGTAPDEKGEKKPAKESKRG